MASALVGAVVGKPCGMLIEEMNKEVSLVCNFRNDFEWLNKKLRNIRDYVTDADARSAQNVLVKSWLLDVADIAWDAEDILEECALQSRVTHCEISQSSCFSAFSCCQLVFRHKMARRIKDVKDRIRSIMEVAAELKLVRNVTHSDQQSSTSTSANARWRGSSVMEPSSRPVAIKSKVEYVLHLLDDPATPAVIAVVGMGGVGKTFLMQNVFDRAKGRFKRSVWLAISQTYSLRKLQAALATELHLKGVVEGRVDEVYASQLIHKHLTRTTGRTLIVLDDVWRATGEHNLISELGLPTGNNRKCKIVVTTRSRNVSSSMNACVYKMHPLPRQKSWDLFCAFAFERNQPPHKLKDIARQIERECGRLPLAVKTVATSLAGKSSSREWESKLKQLKAVSDKEDPILQILKLSFDSLPTHLKPCFAYLCFIPEDVEIDSQYLINLWVAEGYIPSVEDQDQLDIGWSYLCDLHRLCLVEITVHYPVNHIEGHLRRTIKLHDLLLDLAISIAKESQCALSVGESFKADPTGQTSNSYRRILMGKKSIGDGDVQGMASNKAYSASRLRTLCLSQNRDIHNIPRILLSGARVLRVLDLSSTAISSLPDCVGNLKLLRVLNLRRTKISEVPECVKRNKSLHFLDISLCRNLKQFPEWIGELSCLKHLDIRLRSVENKFDGSMPKGISKLLHLQVLKLGDGNKLSVEENEFLKLEHFVNLVNLRELRIDTHHEAELERIEDWILGTFVKMRELTMINHVDNTGNPPPLSKQMLAMKDLEYLYLHQFAVPSWLCDFSNLTQLRLECCNCLEYPALEMMLNLVRLELIGNHICEALPKGFGKPGGFPKLQLFTISDFPALKEIGPLQEGAMPCLETLDVSSCYSLEKVPRGLELLKKLEHCQFHNTGVHPAAIDEALMRATRLGFPIIISGVA